MGEEPESLPESRFRQYRGVVRLEANTLQELVDRMARAAADYASEARQGYYILLAILIEYSGGSREARIWVTPDGVYGVSNIRRGELPERDFYTVTTEVMYTTSELMRYDHEVLGYKGFRVGRASHGEERAFIAEILGLHREIGSQEAAESEHRRESEPEPVVEQSVRQAPTKPPTPHPMPFRPSDRLDHCLAILSVYCSHGCEVEDPEAALAEKRPVILYGGGPSYVCIVPEESGECEYRVVYIGPGDSWEKCMKRKELSKLLGDLNKRGYEVFRP